MIEVEEVINSEVEVKSIREVGVILLHDGLTITKGPALEDQFQKVLKEGIHWVFIPFLLKP